MGPVIEAPRDADAGCRACAAASLLVLGGPGEVSLAVETIQPDLSALPDARRRWLLECCMRAGASPAARAQVRALAGDASTLREAIIATGAHGDPVAVPWLIEPGFLAWWQTNAGRFQAGTRYIAGQPAESLAGCLSVLREGTQRQRRAAAFEMTRQCPGTPLFTVDAFSLRQRREPGR